MGAVIFAIVFIPLMFLASVIAEITVLIDEKKEKELYKKKISEERTKRPWAESWDSKDEIAK